MSDLSWEDYEQTMEEGDWQSEIADLAEDASSSEGDWLDESRAEAEAASVAADEAWSDPGFDPWTHDPGPDPFPELSPLDYHPRFIVVRDDDQDEEMGYSVRGRGQDRIYAPGEYPVYNMPLLRGDAAWCELAATALNERG